ncbi:MAG TPA: Cj0069 family protein [Streptosporangiaceae bacterium]|nr:Cj0069 family protein [Streptosporangiaceae bacterium]
MTADMDSEAGSKIGLLWRGNRAEDPYSTVRTQRLKPLAAALRRLGVTVEPVVYQDDAVDEVRGQLLGLDGILVWVNPIQDGANRSQLDALLRAAAANGAWVSAHPDVIAALGTKEVLYRTRDLGWGTDTDLYSDAADFRARFPAALAKDGIRVLKQARGNGGNGVWKVELAESIASADPPDPDVLVRVRHAMETDGARSEQLRLREFLDRCEQYFAWSGCLVDQPYQQRLADGLIRCYFVHDEVAGFLHQWPTGLLEPAAAPARRVPPASAAEGPDAPAYRALKRSVEQEWIPQMKQLLGIDTFALPAIWDADFLYGPKTADGDDTYVLCEINVSAVWPFPNQATERIAQAAVARVTSPTPGK